MPKRVTGLQIKRTEYQDFSESSPKLLDALERYVPGRLIIGIDLADIEFYHRLRNQLYHHGNGLTVEREKVQVYGELARILFRALFGYEVSPAARPKKDLVASFLSQWAAIESAAVTLLNQKGLRLELERTLELERRHDKVAGGGTMLRALGVAGLISQEQLRELFELRQVRNNLVHFDSEDPPRIDREMIDRLRRVRRNIESQIERS